MRATTLILAACLLAGCATETLRMDVPADLALRGEEIPVASRIVRTGKSPVKFGRYLTSEHYGWSLPTTTTSGHNPYANGKRDVMAVDLTKPGTLWLDRDIDAGARASLAAAAAALLMLQ